MRIRTGIAPATATATVLLLAACGGAGPGLRPGNRSTASAGDPAAAAASTRCTPAAIHRGAPPTWTAAAWSDSSPGFTVPYALASGNAAAAFFFAGQLRAGRPTNPSNKVLWVVRFPRNGHSLTITAQLGTDRSQVVRTSWPADSSPGEIYPSGLDLPTPGCWRLALVWGTHHATLDVQVHPAHQ